MTRTCWVDGCERRHYAHGLCKRDYDRAQRGRPVDRDPRDPVVRYESHVDRSGGPDACHPWTGDRDRYGYGNFHLHGGPVKAHRFGFELHVGKLDGPDVHVRHRCDNPPCQNPRHWLAGSHLDNIGDMVARRRQQHGAAHYAAKLTEQDVQYIRDMWENHRYRGLGVHLADRFGVTPMVISRVVNGKSWRLVA